MNAVWEWITRGAGYVFTVFRDGAAFLVMKVLGAFGLTLVSYNAVLPQLKGFLMQFAGAMPAAATNMASALGVDVMMTMIMSALTIRLAGRVFIAPKAAAQVLQGGAP